MATQTEYRSWARPLDAVLLYLPNGSHLSDFFGCWGTYYSRGTFSGNMAAPLASNSVWVTGPGRTWRTMGLTDNRRSKSGSIRWRMRTTLATRVIILGPGEPLRSSLIITVPIAELCAAALGLYPPVPSQIPERSRSVEIRSPTIYSSGI